MFLGEEGLFAILRAEPVDMKFVRDVTPEKETVTRPTELILMESAVHIDKPESASETADVAAKKDEKNMFRKTTSVKLEHEKNENPRRLYILGEGKSTIGRSNSCDIIVSDKTISREHAVIELHGEEAILVDLGGRNGTRVNQKIVKRAKLANNDSINMGLVTFKFYWSQRGDAVLFQEPLSQPVGSRTGPIKPLPPR